MVSSRVRTSASASNMAPTMSYTRPATERRFIPIMAITSGPIVLARPGEKDPGRHYRARGAAREISSVFSERLTKRGIVEFSCVARERDVPQTARERPLKREKAAQRGPSSLGCLGKG